MNGRILRVLLIEDDDDHAELIKRSLTDNAMPHELVHARDGQEGLDVLLQHDLHPETHAVLPDLILLDLRLPKVDGFEVLRRIKHLESLKHIPVIILTSSEAEQDISRAYDNYANSYLVKPLNFASFSQMMKNIGFYWLGWNKFETDKGNGAGV